MEPLSLPITSDLSLSTWKIEHAAELFSLVDENREILSPWLPWVPFVKEVKDSEKFIIDSIADFKDDKGLELGIWYKDQLAGCIGLHELNRSHKRTSVGYWLGSNFQGKGIMTQAVKALMSYCFTVQDFNRVEIRAATDNLKSRAIPERLGCVEEGILRQAEFVGGKFLDNVAYSMLKNDYLV